jgi:hypothetical protein
MLPHQRYTGQELQVVLSVLTKNKGLPENELWNITVCLEEEAPMMLPTVTFLAGELSKYCRKKCRFRDDSQPRILRHAGSGVNYIDPGGIGVDSRI